MFKIDFCDVKHAAIAFAGTCPICVRRDLHWGAVRPLREELLYRQDLDARLREHYLEEEALSYGTI